MVGGDVTVKAASIFAVMLLFLGLFAFYTASRSTVATALLIFGYVIYSGIYTFLLKRNSVYGTLVGSIAGAMPPVAGYCATNGRFDGGALLLVAIFSIWQMPHSYAIAIFRKSDYQAANIPVLPVVNGVESAKRHIVLHMLAFMFFAPALSLLGYAGQLYLAASVLGGAYWLWLGFKGFGTDNDVKWARKVFFTSILLVTTICAAMAIPI
jgi:protoheme IX farnesyltransferase